MGDLIPFRRRTVRSPAGIKYNFKSTTDTELETIIDNTVKQITSEQDFLHACLAEKARRSLGVDRTTEGTLF